MTPPACDLTGSTKELHSAFSNLVSNAVRYTPDRRPHRACASRATRDGGAELSVQDSGHGIPAAAPAAHHRALLPRVHQPLARKRRHRAWACRSSSTCWACTRRSCASRAKSAAAAPSPACSAPSACCARRSDGSPAQAEARLLDRAAMDARRRPPTSTDARPRALPQPRAGAARVQLPRARAGRATPAVPLLERLRYLCISCTNLDEFFEVRVATVLPAQEFGAPLLPDAHAARRLVLERMHTIARRAGRRAVPAAGTRSCARSSTTPACACSRATSWNAKQTRWLQKYFRNEVLPVLSPLGPRSGASVPAHPQQEPERRRRARRARTRSAAKGDMAIVRAPRSLPRIIQLPEEVSGGQYDFVFLSAVLHRLRRRPVPGHEGQGRLPVPRHAQLRAVRRRGRSREPRQRAAERTARPRLPRGGAAGDRRELPEGDRRHAAAQLRPAEPTAVYRINGPVNLNRVIQIYDLVAAPGPEVPAVRAARACATRRGRACSRRCAKRDVLLHHPYECFGAVLDLLRAGRRPTRTCSRSSRRCTAPASDSPIVEHLIAGRAQRQGRHRRGRAARALRRGGQPQPRRPPAGSRRAGRVRRGRLQDARQDAADRAPRRPHAAPLRAPGHRQLPRRHRARLHRHRPDDRRSGNRRGRARLFSQLSGLAPAIKLKRLLHRRSPCTRACWRRSSARRSTRAPASPRASSPR